MQIKEMFRKEIDRELQGVIVVGQRPMLHRNWKSMW